MNNANNTTTAATIRDLLNSVRTKGGIKTLTFHRDPYLDRDPNPVDAENEEYACHLRNKWNYHIAIMQHRTNHEMLATNSADTAGVPPNLDSLRSINYVLVRRVCGIKYRQNNLFAALGGSPFARKKRPVGLNTVTKLSQVNEFIGWCV